MHATLPSLWELFFKQSANDIGHLLTTLSTPHLNAAVQAFR
jgi:hypothetical protein